MGFLKSCVKVGAQQDEKLIPDNILNYLTTLTKIQTWIGLMNCLPKEDNLLKKRDLAWVFMESMVLVTPFSGIFPILLNKT